MPRSVKCPCCSNELYAVEVLEGASSSRIRGPDLQQESDKRFMVCRHCECAIDFVGSEEIRLSPVQLCVRRG